MKRIYIGICPNTNRVLIEEEPDRLSWWQRIKGWF